MPVQVRQRITLLTEVFIRGSVCELYRVLMNYASMKESAMLLKLMETST
jgi:hypothetical protein